MGVRKGPWNPGGASRVMRSGPRHLGGGFQWGRKGGNEGSRGSIGATAEAERKIMLT